MNEPFVPLSQAASSGQNRTDYRVTIVNQTDNLVPFKLFGHAKKHSGMGTQCEPRVTLQHEGGRVSAIHIQCACGQVIELACVYQTPPAETNA